MGVEAGIAGQRQYLTRFHLQGDDRAAGCDAAPIGHSITYRVSHRLRRDFLQIAINGQCHRARRRAQRAGQFTDDQAAAFDDAQITLWRAGQRVFVGFFNARSAYQIARGSTARLPAFQIISRHRADVADNMRGDAMPEIAARIVGQDLAEGSLRPRDGAIGRKRLAKPCVSLRVHLGHVEARLGEIIGKVAAQRADLPQRRLRQGRKAIFDIGHILLDHI